MKKFSLLFAVALLSLTACLKDGPVNLAPGASPPVIEWSTATIDDAPSNAVSSLYRLYTRSFPIATSVTMALQVDITGTDPAPSDITVGLGVSQAAYNLYFGVTAPGVVPAVVAPAGTPIMPTTLYTMPTSVTILKGTRTATVNVILNTSLFDVSKFYILPIAVTSTTFGGISANYGTVFYQVGAKNKYDGIYSAKGLVVRATDPVLSGFMPASLGLNYSLATTGGNSVGFSQTWATGGGIAGIDGTTITVDPTTNLVTMSATSNPALVNNTKGITDPVGTPGTSYTNRYDPATKTFYLSFYWGTGPTNRAAQDTLVYVKPRP